MALTIYLFILSSILDEFSSAGRILTLYLKDRIFLKFYYINGLPVLL